jgi:restriction endonuclease S subunit
MKETRFKQTEIGAIPEDWEVKTLGDVLDFCTSTIDSKLTNSKYYVTTENMLSNERGIRDFNGKFSVIKGREYRTNDILLSNIRPYLKKIWQADKNGCCSTDILVLRKKNKDDDSKYLYTLLSTDKFFDQMMSTAVGTKMPRGDKNVIKKFKLAFPSTTVEQRHIAQVLSDTDSLIVSLEKLIAKKEAIKQGTMQQLLTGKRRLSGFAKSKEFKQTEIGSIPEDWEVKIMREVFDFYPNNTYARNCLNYSEGEYQNIHYGDVLIKFPAILDCYKEEISFVNKGIKFDFSKYKICEGDVIIADTAEDETVGKTIEVYNIGNKKIVSGLHTILCRPKAERFASRYLGYFMNFSLFHDQLLPFITGIKVSSISKSSLKNIYVVIPSRDEQTAIATILSDMDAEITALHKKLDKYRALKQGMMQQLLTGKIRLAVAEDQPEKKHVKTFANESFRRAVLAAEIADRLCEEPTFGHVKMEKLLFLTEKMCAPEIHSSYHRAAAGPYDNRALHSVDSELSKLQWFKAVRSDNGVRYVPLQKRGAHKMYFERYYGGVEDTFDMIICTFKTAKTEQCEIVATLYSALEDFLNQGIPPSDERIVDEVLNNWNESKKRIERERWLTALDWMRKNGFVPRKKEI